MTPDRRPQFLGEPFHDIHRTRQLAFPRVSDPRGRVRKRKRANGKHSGFYPESPSLYSVCCDLLIPSHVPGEEN